MQEIKQTYSTSSNFISKYFKYAFAFAFIEIHIVEDKTVLCHIQELTLSISLCMYLYWEQIVWDKHFFATLISYHI